MISLKTLRDRMATVEGYITTTAARNYIANEGTCYSTNLFNGQNEYYYKCAGSCSWTCSGSCSRSASG